MIRRKKKIKFYLFSFLLLAVAAYFLFISVESVLLWNKVRNISSTNGLAKVCDADDKVSYTARPNLNGECFYQYPDSSKTIPIYTDSNGNRSSLSARQVNSSRKFLFFGCSFTFGVYCDADSTYPFIVSRNFGAQCINTAVAGYGYSNMLLKAKDAVPRYKPEIVFVQYTDWLIDRSQSIYNTSTRLLKISTPFFYKDQAGVHVSPPLTTNRDMISLINDISNKRKGFFTQAGLILRAAWVMIKKDFISAKIYLMQELKMLPEPMQNDQELLNYVLEEFRRLCAENHCKLVIVGINEQTHSVDPGLTYVNTQEALNRNAETIHRGYDTLYSHWTIHPRKTFDGHPNNYAHRVIASAIIQKVDSLMHE